MPTLPLEAVATFKPKLYKTADFRLTAVINVPHKDDVVLAQRIVDKVQPIMAAQIKQYEDAMRGMDAVLEKRLALLKSYRAQGKRKELLHAQLDLRDFKKTYDTVIVQYKGSCERKIQKTIADAIATEARDQKKAKATKVTYTVKVLVKLGGSVLSGLLGAGVGAAGIGTTVATAGAGSPAGILAIVAGSASILASAVAMVKTVYTELMGLMAAESELRDQIEDAIDDIEVQLKKHARHVKHGTKEDKTFLEKAAALFQGSHAKKLKDLLGRHRVRVVAVRLKADAMGRHLVAVLKTITSIEGKMTELANSKALKSDPKKVGQMKELLKKLAEFKRKAASLPVSISKVSQRLDEGLAVDEKAMQWIGKVQKTLPSSGPGVNLPDLATDVKDCLGSVPDIVVQGLGFSSTLATLKLK